VATVKSQAFEETGFGELEAILRSF